MNKKYSAVIPLILVGFLIICLALILMRQYITINNNLDRSIPINEIIRETITTSIKNKTIIAVVTEPQGQPPIAKHYIYFFDDQFFGKKRLLLKKTINEFIHYLKLIELKDIDDDQQDEFLIHVLSGKYYELVYIFDYTEDKITPIQFNRDGKVRDFVFSFEGKILFEDIDKQTKGLEVSTFTEAPVLVQEDISYYKIISRQEFYHLIDGQYIKYNTKEEIKKEEISF